MLQTEVGMSGSGVKSAAGLSLKAGPGHIGCIPALKCLTDGLCCTRK